MPRSFFKTWNTRADRNFHYTMRNSHEYDIPRHKYEYISKLPFCNIPRTWNNFNDPKNLRSISSLNRFCFNLKKELLERILLVCNSYVVAVTLISSMSLELNTQLLLSKHTFMSYE